jgi:hypothetical protein
LEWVLEAGTPSEKLNQDVRSGCFVRQKIEAPTGKLLGAVPERMALG